MRLWIYALAVISGLVLTGCQQVGEHAAVTVEAPVKANPLVGTWRLVSWKLEEEDGSIRHPYGDAPKGQIIYTAGGHMSAQLMYPGAELENLDGLDAAAAISKVAKTFFAYNGRYTIDEAAGTVTHHVEGCLSPAWVGMDQVRNFRFQDPDHLVLSARLDEETNVPGMNTLQWERIE